MKEQKSVLVRILRSQNILSLAGSLAVTPAISGTATYTYDARGDLSSAGYTGGPSITYAYDALGNRTSETIVNAPLAQNSVATVPYNATNASLPLNITNATGLQITAGPAHGAANVSSLSILYTPTTGYSGADSVVYVATNAAGSSAPATVSITVNPAPPIAGNVNATVAYNSGYTNIPLSLSGGQASSVAVNSAPAHGSAQASGITISYQPATGYSGADAPTTGTAALALPASTV